MSSRKYECNPYTKFNAMSDSSHPEKHLSASESFRNISSSKEMQCENNTEFLTETDEDATPLVVLSVIFQGHKIGGAFYDLDTCHLYLLPDHVETAPSYSVLRLFLKQAQPCAIVTSSRTDENVLNILREITKYAFIDNSLFRKNIVNIDENSFRHWFLLPSNDPNLLGDRQAAVKYFVSTKNSDIMSTLQGSLKHIKFLPRIITRMKTAQASMNDWMSLYKISSTFSTDLFRIASLLNKIIDFEEYARQNHFVVKPGVDSELDKMKRTYNGLPDFMTQVAYQELQDLSQEVQQCSVIYLPQLGYLLAIPATDRMKETKDYSIPNLRFMFIVNDIVHYKSTNTKKLDALLGDTLCDIYDKETQIMHKLQDVILEMKHVLTGVMEYAAKLDCLIALAVTAKEYNWVQPEISHDGELAVLKGRHPLQEMCVASFVANDIYSGDSESKIKILTGPNCSGKSIYLTQVALIAFMAHIGSFVPAQKAKIPMLDCIFTCMYAAESVSLNLSGFLISLNQFSAALNNATTNSLVIVDEFGKDTESESGLALLTSSLNFWIQKGSESPHIFLATHYLSLGSIFSECPFIKFQVDYELIFSIL
ncbi:mutS protein homolog 5 [Trichonephila inaurata madagascariensis]|uniref:MutS protein homolog 5 n=1 Tax=Trichonephila inaurata madagascariensis TaxID=2747483 RepID=A0A8X6X9R5_9ARAC|nr:mutS protein homolog 5 [Trichonephila inaurata madagascariensis]